MASPTIHLHMIDVQAPVQVVFDKWAQYESFPLYMKHVEAVAHRIAWTAESAPKHSGEVTFHEIDATTTWIVLEIEHDPDGFLEHVANKFGIVSARIEGELKNFKAYVEANI